MSEIDTLQVQISMSEWEEPKNLVVEISTRVPVTRW